MKIGLEIHQRLDSKKLFCNCPSMLMEKDAEPDQAISRRLHPVFSELGEIDEASRTEFSKDRTFCYQSFSHSNCLVELDEEPPHQLNQLALETVLEISLRLNASPVKELHVMRKMVIDGSNTSGFQRTAVLAMNGTIDSSKGPIRIPLIAIEEESAGIIGNNGSDATYRLDRLGIPLIEISTDPVIKDGAHLKEVAEKLGMLLRATGKVARGLGTIRQDVNISTEGGARVEVKGAQDLKMLPEIAQLECGRQTELIKLIHGLRMAGAYTFVAVPADITEIFPATNSQLIKTGLSKNCKVFGIRLPKHAGILGTELQPNRRYGSELSDYAKLAGVKGIIHSDEDLSTKYGISASEILRVKSTLSVDERDAFVIVVAPESQALKALEFVILRAKMDYVPEETRRANPDGTSSFMRPLPGRARLYPETDVPPIQITDELLKKVRSSMGESLEEKEEKLSKILNPEMAKKMIKSRNLRLFEELVSSGNDPMLVAVTIGNTIVSLNRDGVKFLNTEKSIRELFAEYKKGTFVKAAIPDILKHMAKGTRPEAVLKVFRLAKLSGKELEAIAKEENYDLGNIMKKYRLQVEPSEVSELVKKHKKL